MHELRTEKPWQHGVGPGFNSRRLHVEAPGSYVGPGVFFYILGFIVGCPGSKRLCFGEFRGFQDVNLARMWHGDRFRTRFGLACSTA